jgi:RNA polymerase sigma-70 factor (ECF subfamily)
MSPEPFAASDDVPKGQSAPRAVGLSLVVPASPVTGASVDDFDDWMLAVAHHQDKQAFARLFEHFAPRLKTWLMRSGSEPALADDLVQDTFVALWRKAQQFDPARAHVAAWLFTIARNLRIDRHRGWSETWLSLDAVDVAQVPDPALGFDVRLAARQSDDSVRRALRCLTADQRTLVQLSFYEAKSHSCIADELRLPLGTVKTRLRAAASRLRQLLEEDRP